MKYAVQCYSFESLDCENDWNTWGVYDDEFTAECVMLNLEEDDKRDGWLMGYRIVEVEK